MIKKLAKLFMCTAILFFSCSISSVASSSSYRYPLIDQYAETTSIKGTQPSPNDLTDYGIQHTFNNYFIDDHFIPDEYPECGVRYYEFEGKKYRFYEQDDYFARWVKRQNDAGITVNVQFMVRWEDNEADKLTGRRILIDEDARHKSTSSLYYAPAVSGEGRQAMRAFWSWFMEHLAKYDAHVDNFILGNEVNMPSMWHYSGDVGTRATVEKYATAFYDMHQIVRNYTGNSRCSICVDHSWTHDGDGIGIGAKEYIEIFHDTLTYLNGGSTLDDWCLSLHLYPAVLYETEIWENADNYNDLSEDALFVDGRNLSYITNYIKNNYGENHRIMLTEQGFTVYRGEDAQAASLAYSYYAAKYDPMVDCFILNLENVDGDKLDFRIEGRKAQNVYKYIDDPSQQSWIASSLLPVIGVSSWNEIVPNYGLTIHRKTYEGSGFVRIDPYGIGLDYTTINLYKGSEQVIPVTVVPDDAYDKSVVWTSSNTGVASVDQDGLVTANGAGTAVITAHTVNGLSTQCTVNVMVDPTAISLSETSANMIAGESLTLTALISPWDVTESSLTWNSSNTDVAVVNDGIVTAYGAGKVIITAQTVNGLTAQCEIISVIDSDPENPFADVKSTGSWEYSFARFVYDNHYMSGKGELIPGRVLFDPNSPLTRAEFVQVLYNLEGKPAVTYNEKFTDVPNGKWFTNAVTWAEQNGIVAGKGEIFDVDAPATREQLAVMFYHYAEYKKYDLESVLEGSKDINSFDDVDQISTWAENGLKWALSHKVMSGKGANIDPLGNARRSECAAMLKNFLNAFQAE